LFTTVSENSFTTKKTFNFTVLCAESKYKCGDECIEDYLPCNGVCLTTGNQSNFDENRFKCPNAERCVSIAEMCNVDIRRENYNDQCFGQNLLSYTFCDKLSSSNRTVECEGLMCPQSKECISSSGICNGFIDCFDRSDESMCPEKLGQVFNYSIFSYCEKNSTIGFKCGKKCIPNRNWCNSFPEEIIREEYKLKFTDCPSLLNTLNHKKLCQNFEFWQWYNCNSSIGFEHLKTDRCTGNYPGQCRINECQDISDKIKAFDFNVGHTMKCRNNQTFVHEELWCDGYPQCPDKSDEDPDECGNCPRTYGFPSNKKSATFSCEHKYTGRPICAVPCDGKDDQCLDDIDEQCSSASIKSIILFGIALIVATVFVGELPELCFPCVRKIEGTKRETYNLLNLKTNSLLNILECLSINKKASAYFKKGMVMTFMQMNA
jgi:hypothetical protein